MRQVFRIPGVTLGLIALLFLAAVVAMVSPDIVTTLGFRAARPNAICLVTSLFIHINLLHLLGNLIFLAAAGPPVEFAIGRWRFLVLFFTAGVVGNLVHWLFERQSTSLAPIVGASGAIAGCVALASIRYMGVKVPITPRVSAPIAAIVAIWVFLQAVGAFVQLGSGEVGVAYWSHMGGFLAGMLLGLLFKAPKMASLSFGHEVLDRINHMGPAARLSVAQQLLLHHPGDLRAMVDIAEAHQAMGDRESELKMRLEIMKIDPSQPHTIERLSQLGAIHRISTRDRCRLADELRELDPRSSNILLESVAKADILEPERPQALLALVELNWKDDQAAAGKWLEILGRDYPLDPAIELAKARGYVQK